MNSKHRMTTKGTGIGVPLEDAIECIGPGWTPLIKEVYIEMLNHPGVLLTQVKEKFGMLRIYWDAPSRTEVDTADLLTFSDFIRMTETKSGTICELCGKDGKVKSNNRGWLLSRCPDHEDHEI